MNLPVRRLSLTFDHKRLWQEYLSCQEMQESNRIVPKDHHITRADDKDLPYYKEVAAQVPIRFNHACFRLMPPQYSILAHRWWA